MKALRVVVRVLLAIIVMTAPASVHARGGGKHHKPEASTQKKVDDTEYQKALKSIPDQKPADPWSRLR